MPPKKYFAEDDGLRALIFKKFLWPLFKIKPSQMSLTTFIQEQIFHLSEREINTFKADKPFQMPGRLRINMLSSVQGAGYRHIHKGAKLFVRNDSTTPDVWEIETYIGAGHKEAHFLLTFDEWFDIRYTYLSPSNLKLSAKRSKE